MSGAGTLIVGVGYTGRRLLERLPEALGLSRSTSDERVRAFDLDTADSLPVSFSRDDSLVYTVPPARDDGDARLRTFLGLLHTAPRRIVYLSTTGVYGDRGGEAVDESTPISPSSDRARRRAAAEALLTRWCDSRGSELVILRVPGIYGPGRLGISRIADCRPVLREDGANPGNRIHVDDLVECCLAGLSSDRPPGVYNVGDGDSRSSTWFAMEVARQAGLSPPPTVSRAEARQSFSAGRLSFLAESRTLDLTRMNETLRPALRYRDPAAGIAASLVAETRTAPE